MDKETARAEFEKWYAKVYAGAKPHWNPTHGDSAWAAWQACLAAMPVRKVNMADCAKACGKAMSEEKCYVDKPYGGEVFKITRAVLDAAGVDYE